MKDETAPRGACARENRGKKVEAKREWGVKEYVDVEQNPFKFSRPKDFSFVFNTKV